MIRKEKGLAVQIKIAYINCSANELIKAGRAAILNEGLDAKKDEGIRFARARRALVIQRIAAGYGVDLQEPGAARKLLNEMEADTNPEAGAIARKVRSILGDRISELSLSEEDPDNTPN